MEQLLLLDIFFYFGATVVCVPLFKAFGLGSVLGYLVAGIILGPHGFKLLHHAENIQEISQIGIIMLLFVIGLELTPARLKHLKNVILGDGLGQFVLTTAIFTGLGLFFDLTPPTSIIIASALSLSSTAFCLTYLRDTDQLTKSYGQASFGVLIFQDLIIIPILTIIPFINANVGLEQHLDVVTISSKLGLFFGIFTVGKYALEPVLKKVFDSQNKEIFTGTCLMLIIGSALLMEYLGLSKALGAFVAGIFLSNSNFRAEIQSFTIPLKSMLMGVFFMGFGLEFDLAFLKSNIANVFLLACAFMAIKFTVFLGLGRTLHKDWKTGTRMGLILCQGGEFGFLIIASLVSYSLLPLTTANYLLSSITLSIFMAPFLTKALDLVNHKFQQAQPAAEVEPENNVISLEEKIIEKEEEVIINPSEKAS